MTVHVRLLGPAYAGKPGTGLHLPSDKRGYLLAYLACSGEWVSRDHVALLFWPDADELSARRNLRQLLSRIKKLSLAQELDLTPSHIRWHVETDVANFRLALAQADYATAVALYAGSLLQGFLIQEVSGFEAWLELERENLHRAFHNAALHHAQALEAAGDYKEARGHLKQLLDYDPLAEDVLQRYLRVLYLCGQRDTALETYARFSRSLEQELALEPLGETQELISAIREAAPIAVASPSITPTPLVPMRVLRPPRLVGREQACAEALATVSPVVLIKGEPGIGKTRFLQELLPSAAWTYCHEGLTNIPYAPLTTFIRANLEHLPELGPYREDLARLVPEIAPDLVAAPLEPQMAKARLLEALARIKEAFDAPIVIDDLQWADPATLETLVFLASRAKGRCYGTYRSGEESPALLATLDILRTKGLVSVIHLEALPEDALQSLLADLIGNQTGPALFSRWLWGRSGGNPMFALETLKSLFEAGVLRADSKGWHTDIDDVTRDYSELDIPPAVSEVIMRRVDRLPAQTVRVMQAAAVVQEGLDAKLLGQVSGLSEWAVLDALEEAEGAGLIAGVGFQHDLIRQSVYRQLNEGRKRLLHARVAEALANTTDPIIVAEHLLLAGDLGQASTYWMQAATMLRQRGLHHQAVTLLGRVTKSVPEIPENLLFLQLKFLLAKLLTDIGHYDQAGRIARAFLATPLQPAYRALALHVQGLEFIYEGKAQQAEEVMLEAVALHDPLLAKNLGFHPLTDLGYAKALSGKAFEAFELWERERLQLEREPPSPQLVMLLIMIGGFYDRKGEPSTGLRMHQQAFELARQVGARHYQSWAVYNILNSSFEAGATELEEHLPVAEAVLELGDYGGTPFLRDALIEAYLHLGRYREAEGHIAQLKRHAPSTMLGLIQARQAELAFSTGKEHEGHTALCEAVHHIEQSEYPAFLAVIVLAVLRHGDDALVRSIGPYMERVQRGHGAVFPYLLRALETAEARRSTSSA